MIHFDLPKEQSSILKVIGIGGGGSNAVNHMYSQNIDGVNFIICNPCRVVTESINGHIDCCNYFSHIFKFTSINSCASSGAGLLTCA